MDGAFVGCITRHNDTKICLTGPIVLHQWPEGAITCTQRSRRKPLLDFSSISEFVIPRQDLCQQPISICFDGLRIIGHPVCLVDAEKYARNEYMFNFCMVVKEHVEFSAYEKAVDKIAKVLSEAEVQEDYLLNDEAICLEDATDESDPERYASKVQAFCENCVEDLNRYNECVIPLSRYCIMSTSLPVADSKSQRMHMS